LRSHERCFASEAQCAYYNIIIIIFSSAEWKPRRSRTRRAIKTSDWITEDVNYRTRSGNRRRPAYNLRGCSIALSQSIYIHYIMYLYAQPLLYYYYRVNTYYYYHVFGYNIYYIIHYNVCMCVLVILMHFVSRANCIRVKFGCLLLTI